jgi:hypothetical protein
MTLVQLRVAMAGLDPWAFSPRTRSVGIDVLATGTGDANNRVDAQVKPAHDELQLVPIKTQHPIPVPRTALRESSNLRPWASTAALDPRLREGDERRQQLMGQRRCTGTL